VASRIDQGCQQRGLSYACLFLSCIAKNDEQVGRFAYNRTANILRDIDGALWDVWIFTADRRLSTFPLITGQSPSRKYLGFTIASYVAWKQNIIMCNRTLSALQRARWCMHKRNLAARLISVATRAKYLCTMQNFKLWHIRVICNFVLNVVNLQLLHLCPFLSNVDWH